MPIRPMRARMKPEPFGFLPREVPAFPASPVLSDWLPWRGYRRPLPEMMVSRSAILCLDGGRLFQSPARAGSFFLSDYNFL
jgi:hypothetical protein